MLPTLASVFRRREVFERIATEVVNDGVRGASVEGRMIWLLPIAGAMHGRGKKKYPAQLCISRKNRFKRSFRLVIRCIIAVLSKICLRNLGKTLSLAILDNCVACRHSRVNNMLEIVLACVMFWAGYLEITCKHSGRFGFWFRN